MSSRKKMSVSAPVLRQFAGLWTLMEQPTAAREWTLEEKIKRAKQAGFDGIGSQAFPELAPLLKKYEMDFVCYIDANLKNYRSRLEAARPLHPRRINVQLCNHDTPPREAVRVWLKLEALAEKMGLSVDLELHRDTCTETPEKADEIAALYQKATGKKIRFCWDFSHPAVVKHLQPPYAKRLLTRPDLIQRARQFHFRPFNGHHAQVAITNGKGVGTPEGKAYLEFVDAVMTCWFQGARGGEVVYACPEFGPVSSGYGLSTCPNVWEEAILLRGKIEALWKAHARRAKGKRPAGKA